MEAQQEQEQEQQTQAQAADADVQSFLQSQLNAEPTDDSAILDQEQLSDSQQTDAQPPQNESNEQFTRLYAQMRDLEKSNRALKQELKAKEGGASLKDLILSDPSGALELAIDAMGGDDADEAESTPHSSAIEKQLDELKSQIASLLSEKEEEKNARERQNTLSSFEQLAAKDSSDRWQIIKTYGQDAYAQAIEISKVAKEDGHSISQDVILDALEEQLFNQIKSQLPGLIKLTKVAKLIGVSAQDAPTSKQSSTSPSLTSGGGGGIETGSGDPKKDAVDFLEKLKNRNQ